jgi:hypothetical protein
LLLLDPKFFSTTTLSVGHKMQIVLHALRSCSSSSRRNSSALRKRRRRRGGDQQQEEKEKK